MPKDGRSDVISTTEEKIAQIGRSYDEAEDNYDRMSKWYDLTEGVFESYYRNLGI